MTLREKIIDALKKATGESEIQLEFPENEEFGDYSSNIAMAMFSKLQNPNSKIQKNFKFQPRSGLFISNFKNPQELAEVIVNKLTKDQRLMTIVDKIEVAGPGFINFWLSEKALIDTLVDINTKKDTFGRSDTFKGKKIMVEFAHPNTHKPFHIGHLRNIATGESIARHLAACGAKVIRVNYQGDVGLHIAKAIWGIKKLGFKDPGEVGARADFLGKTYVEGNKAYEEEGQAKDEIEEINKSLYQGEDKDLLKIYQVTRKWSLDYFDEIYKRVYTKFDRLYFESEVADPGKMLVYDALKKGIFEKSQGAIIYPGKRKGLHDRVFITAKDIPTYEAKELGLADLQFSEYKPDQILHVVGPEQKGYFDVLFKALEELYPETKGKEVHIIYGWVRLKEGKMSSREGNVVLAEWLMDEVNERIRQTYKSSVEIAEQVAIGAIKYSYLKVGLSQDIAFDIKESISLEGNSAPYLQYTYARTNSVLQKSSFKGLTLQGGHSNPLKLNPEELSVLRTLPRFPEITIDVAKNYTPNLLCNYLFDLAQKYNNFYNQHRIIGSKNQEFRILLTFGVGQILKSGLTLLGIKAPEKM